MSGTIEAKIIDASQILASDSEITLIRLGTFLCGQSLFIEGTGNRRLDQRNVKKFKERVEPLFSCWR